MLIAGLCTVGRHDTVQTSWPAFVLQRQAQSLVPISAEASRNPQPSGFSVRQILVYATGLPGRCLDFLSRAAAHSGVATVGAAVQNQTVGTDRNNAIYARD